MSIFDTLTALSQSCCSSDTTSNLAVEENERVSILDRGVSFAFLKQLRRELADSGRESCDSGQLVHGAHTSSSATDFEEFDRSRDDRCMRAVTLHTGLSLVETCMMAGVTESPSGEPYFGRINTFVSYTWRGDGATFAKLIDAILEAPAALNLDGESRLFVDILVCAQNRGMRASHTCANSADVGVSRTLFSLLCDLSEAILLPLFLSSLARAAFRRRHLRFGRHALLRDPPDATIGA